MIQVGRLDSAKPAAIRLSGDNILEEHCFFENADGKVVLNAQPNSATVYASGVLCVELLIQGVRSS